MTTPIDLPTLVQQGLDGHSATADQALAVLRCSDDELLDVVAAAGRIRRHYFSNEVTINYLVNIKSGLCPEDCGYCSQRRGSEAEVLKYSWLTHDDVVNQASVGIAAGAHRVCLVASGRGPADKDVDRVAGVVESLKSEHPDVEVCVCLGLLRDGQGERLAEAGADAYNHNVNTSASRYAEVCSTHSHEDRLETIDRVRNAGLSPCSGFIAGLGESDEELVEMAVTLAGTDADSIPVNFLMPFEGTPLSGQNLLSPQRCLRILAMVRFVCPQQTIRMAAGREMHLRGLQTLALHVANSIFLGDYLTSEGDAADDDLALIRDAGFVPRGSHLTATESDHGPSARPADSPQVAHRTRGAGTSAPANA